MADLPPKVLRDQVLVITDALSPIGVAAAEAAVERGARVVLAARSEDEAASLTERLNRHGERATLLTIDMSDPNAAERLADHAETSFGRIDTWINNATAAAYGRLVEMPLADMRRAFETNFWGTVTGCRVAVDRLRDHGGVIINIGSPISEEGRPQHGIHEASKGAIEAFTRALRLELEADHVPIRTALVRPARRLDAPSPGNARREMAGATAERSDAARDVVEAILRSAERPVHDVTISAGSRVAAALATVAPTSDEPLSRAAGGPAPETHRSV
jgi:short-subunit dehydrogenase